MPDIKEIRKMLNYKNPVEHKIRMAKIMLDEVIEKEALKQPAQEPAYWIDGDDINKYKWECYSKNPEPLYTHPHQWVGLTDDELSHLKYLHVDYELFDEGEYGTECNVYVDDFAKAIEQLLKEKNT